MTAYPHQPVADALGPRFYDWQLSQSVAESWEECERHAAAIEAILGKGAPVPDAAKKAAPPTDLFGERVATDLFGNVEQPKTRRR